MEILSVSVPITADSLPVGKMWDEDGACFEAIRCDPATTGREWRWAARNFKALAKGNPDKPMFDHAPLSVCRAVLALAFAVP